MTKVLMAAIVLVACVANLSFANTDIALTKPAISNMLSSCDTLKSKKAKTLCRDVITKRLTYYKAYVEKLQSNREFARKSDNKLIIKKRESQSACLSGNMSMCNEYIKSEKTRESLFRWAASQRISTSIMVKNVQIANRETVELLRSSYPKAKLVCKLSSTGLVRCAPISSLLAMYDGYMGSAIIKDINGLYDNLPSDHRGEVLVGCGAGAFVGTDLTSITNELSVASPSFSVGSQIGIISNNGSMKINKICEQIANASSQSSGALSGFSGITGIDSQSIGEICGHKTSKAFKEFVDGAMGMAQALSQTCATNAVAEGTDDPVPPIVPVPPTPEPQPTPPPDPNPPDPCPPTTGCAPTPTQPTPTTTTDPNTGNVTVQQSTTYTNGAKQVTTITLNAQGQQISKVVTVTYADNSTYNYIKITDPNSGKSSTSIIQTDTASGVVTNDYWSTNQNGTVTSQLHMVNYSSGNSIIFNQSTHKWNSMKAKTMRDGDELVDLIPETDDSDCLIWKKD